MSSTWGTSVRFGSKGGGVPIALSCSPRGRLKRGRGRRPIRASRDRLPEGVELLELAGDVPEGPERPSVDLAAGDRLAGAGGAEVCLALTDDDDRSVDSDRGEMFLPLECHVQLLGHPLPE